MAFTVSVERFTLKFRSPSGTSRGVLTEKPSWIISIKDNVSGITGKGECSLIPGLSPEHDLPLEERLKQMVSLMNESQELELPEGLESYPALVFALESALLDYKNGGRGILFDNPFSKGEKGILINGLIWMGEPENMWQQVLAKVEAGFSCIKLKIGAIHFDQEIALLRRIRDTFGNKITLRVDANGGFAPEESLEVLKELSKLHIHSIEQPIRQDQWGQMAKLCQESPVPVALDEELIGIAGEEEKRNMLETIKPQYIILKPSLAGGFASCDEWIAIANELGIGWWATSALESNIGLNAIAQWAASYDPALPQGLGTGGLFTNNIPMPLEIKGESIWRAPAGR